MFVIKVKKKLVLTTFLIGIFLFVLVNLFRLFISATGSPWIQIDWSSGVGTSTINQYSSSSNVVTSTNNQITLIKNEKASNLGFESDLNSWSSGDTPDQISGLKIWLKADAIVGKNDNDLVSSWDDSSGNSNGVTASSGKEAKYNTNIINGQPVVTFDAANQSTLKNLYNLGTPYTLLYVSRLTGGANGRVLSGISTNWLLGYWSAKHKVFYADGTLDLTGLPADTNWYLYSATGSGALSTGYENGTQWVSGNGGVSGINGFSLGSYGGGASEWSNAQIAELIGFNSALNVTDRAKVEAYLANKYGLSSTLYLTSTRDTGIKRTGSSSAKLVTGTSTGDYVQKINVGNTNKYNLVGYVYTNGSAVTSSDVELFYNGGAVTTTYTSAGSGWYKLSASITGANAVRTFGVQVKTSKTIYLDDFSVQGYELTGNLVSNIYDTNSGSDWGNLAYALTLPSNTTVDVKVRSGNQVNLSDASNFSACSAINSGSDISGGCSPDNKRYVQYELTFTSDGISTPTFTSITIENSPSDMVPPSVNASNIIMYRTNGGTTVSSLGWTSLLSPKFTWDSGVDETSIKGYCLKLVNKTSLAPNFDDTSPTDLTNITFNSSGLINSSNSPVVTTGSNCSFIISGTEIDFSNQAYRLSPWLTTSTDPYYIFVKVIDVGNNIYTGPASFIKFRVDLTSPTNVSYISSASGTFGNVNDMNFSWPVTGSTASGDNDSGLLGWQYQINSSIGTWEGPSTNSALGVNYIPSNYTDFPYFLTSEVDGPNIQIGNNVIYFRTIDNSGNVSNESSLRTANIAFGGDAPTFPTTCENTTGITITPTTSTSNSFSLSWPAATPAPDRSISKYYYMINTEPPSTLATITSNTATYIESNSTNVSTNSLSGVVKGANYVNVIAVDDINIYSSTNCLKGIFNLNSNLPDPPSSLSVSDASIKSARLWRASLAWGLPEYKGTGILSYKIERSDDGLSWTTIETTTGNAYLDTVNESKRYYWRVSTMDNTVESNNNPSASNAVTTIPKGVYTEPPALTSKPQSLDLSTKKAKISWTTSRESDSKIAYGIKSGEYLTEEVYNSDKETNHLISLTNLIPGTLYYYIAKWTDEDGNTGTSEELSFRTSDAPNVKDVSVTNISITSALIKYTSKGANNVRIYYGKNTGFGGFKEIPTSPIEASYTSQLTELDDGSKYYYKINTLDQDGNEYQGTTLDFTTLPRPRLFDINFSQIKGTAQPSVLVSWNSNTEVSTVISYYESSNSNNVKDETNPNLIKGINRAILRSLNPETNYAMVIKARDKIGNEVISDIYQFTTAIDTRPPTVSGLKIESVIQTNSGQGTSAQIIISWNTDKPSTSQVEFGEGTNGNYSQKTQEETNLKQNHLVVISDLTPSKVYSIRALSRDKAGNIGKSGGNNTLTPKAVDSALDIVITILSDAFGFLSNISK